MRKLTDAPTWSKDGVLHVVIESPKGSALKLKYEPALDAITVSRPLPAGIHYPYDWGFIPSTCAEDGDPLDAMVLSPSASSPGVIWACQPIGAVLVTQPGPDGTRVRNDRILALPVQSARTVRDVSELSDRERAELEQFFLAAVALDKPGVEVVGWAGPAEARATIERAAR